MDYIPSRPCADVVGVRRFYRRQGAYLALLYVLQGRDIHSENLIADGEYPVLVDLECLMHSEPLRHREEPDAKSARELMEATVLATGLLPSPTTFRDDGEIVRTDLSGLSASHTISPSKVIVWDGEGSDDMRLVQRHIGLPPTQHMPIVDDEPRSILSYDEELKQGFQDMYRLFLSHTEPLLAPGGPLARFAGAKVRVLLRSTQVYSDVLDQAYHPDLLRDALDRDHYICMTLASQGSLVCEDLIVESERRQISNGDVPLFMTTTDSVDVVSGDGARLNGMLAQSGLDAARTRLRSLDEGDLSRQTWIVRAALAAAGLAGRAPEWPRHAVPWPSYDASNDALLDAAVMLGTSLLQQAIPLDDSIAWLGIQPVEESYWELRGIDSDLYSGTSGLAVFLTYLGELSGEDRFREAAYRLISAFPGRLERLAAARLPTTEGLLGMVGAVDGPLYALSHWAAVSGDHGPLIDGVRMAGPLLHGAIEMDASLDLVGGIAATVLVLDSTLAVYADADASSLLVDAADKLVEGGRWDGDRLGWPLAQFDGRALAGASHGASGMALALGRAWLREPKQEWLEAAQGAINFERSMFDGALPGWPDLRPGIPGPGMTTAWCHGSPGIGLVRLALAERAPEVGAADDIAVALSATLAHYDACYAGGNVRLGNLSLCHGEIGNLEFLSWCARFLRDGDLARRVRRLQAAALELARRYGWLCGVPHGVSNPGLMTGLSGIGYGLLRLATQGRIPSVLTLDPPILDTASSSRDR